MGRRGAYTYANGTEKYFGCLWDETVIDMDLGESREQGRICDGNDIG